ncbi:MAG TPA: hypothetical protein VFA26_03400 [Gemmataceae bacterium]|nr:hypothetical protein [Gemmataceae bacterium]
MAVFPFAFLLFPLSLSPLGCHNCDLVEAELRNRDEQLRQVRDEMDRLAAYNEALRREVWSLRGGGCQANFSPEFAAGACTLKSVALGRGTGGYDADDCSGDEALQVIVEPRDPDGHVIKAPGSLDVLALQINREGLKTPLSSWHVPPEALRRSWRSGLLSTGYVLVLPWKMWPTEKKVRVVARFILPDGRVFEADKDVSVRPTPLAQQKAARPEPADLPMNESPPFEAPPPPRKLEGPPVEGRRDAPGRGGVQPAAGQAGRRPSLADAVQGLPPVPLGP